MHLTLMDTWEKLKAYIVDSTPIEKQSLAKLTIQELTTMAEQMRQLADQLGEHQLAHPDQVPTIRLFKNIQNREYEIRIMGKL